MSKESLETRVSNLAVGVIGLTGALKDIQRLFAQDIQGLQDEIDTQRKLSKYNRRTHFQMMFFVVLFAVHLRSAAEVYEDDIPQLFAFLFWLKDYGYDGLRVLGFATQALIAWFLWHRAQVPDSLFNRVAAGADAPEGSRSLYNRLIGRK